MNPPSVEHVFSIIADGSSVNIKSFKSLLGEPHPTVSLHPSVPVLRPPGADHQQRVNDACALRCFLGMAPGQIGLDFEADPADPHRFVTHFPNPDDPSRKIHLTVCGDHCLKVRPGLVRVAQLEQEA